MARSDNGAPGVPARPRRIRRRKRAVPTSFLQLNHPEKSTCPLQLRKQSLFIMKFPRVHAAAAPPHFYRMLQMQHLVKQNVLDRITRHPRMIKNAADNNRIVRRIVMSQTAARLFSAPGELRAPHQPMKKSPVQIVENFFQMIMMSARRMDVLASSHLPDEPGLRRNVVARDIAAITRALPSINRLAIELREQYVGDRMQHRFRSAFQQIGEPRIDLSLPQSNRIVNRNKRIEAKMHRRGRRARPQFAINFMKNFAQLLKHVEGRVARLCRKQDRQNAKSKSTDNRRFASETAPVICPCETSVPPVVKICADSRTIPRAPCEVS
jgi:hypothetical protein